MKMSRQAKRIVMVAYDSIMVPFAIWASISLRHGTPLEAFNTEQWIVVALTTIITIAAFIRLGLYRAIIRFMGRQAALSMLMGISLSVLGLIAASFMITKGGMTNLSSVPRSAPIIYGFVALFVLGLPRFLIRNYYQLKIRRGKQLAVIYGAGASGVELANALAHGNRYLVTAFLDDDESIQSTQIHGIRVYSPNSLASLLQRYDISTVLLALPSCTPKRRSEILNSLENHSVKVKSVPSMTQIVSGDSWIEDLQDLDVNDLLGRDQVEPDRGLISECIRGKVVMITGAGGSIGSELCRQIVRYQPRVVVLYEISEFALYELNKELQTVTRNMQVKPELVPFLGSVQDRGRLRIVMETFEVQTIYHAAAYKHVPLVELNIIQGIQNNAFGTYYTAAAAIDAGVENFVLVSTDKAVRPTNVMGATKRFAELTLQALAQEPISTSFSIVRFGNVLGSSGSVVPLFREQIRGGGPVTVTHPDVTRYFMTVSEAAELVLQAGAMTTGGDVFVLDMGEPVKISELARKMIHLMGHKLRDEESSDGIPIIYTGLRAGEKLHEELLIGSDVSGTAHPRILRANEFSLSWTDIKKMLDELELACAENACERARAILKDSGAEYLPVDNVKDILWCELNRDEPRDIGNKPNIIRLSPPGGKSG